ncbi:hypothetical protein GCM10023226_06430 [Nocardioides nanhaiensis]|uniref:Uncharacterized protein n=1 Tax=Nocardioides nanhaiensis TaxID=1476871 RepID=A0ABP8VVT0_9ACTN
MRSLRDREAVGLVRGCALASRTSDKRGWAVIFGRMSDETMQVARQHRALVVTHAADEDRGAATQRCTPEHPAATTRRTGSS